VLFHLLLSLIELCVTQSWKFTYHRFIYLLLSHLVEILLYSVCRATVIGAESTGFDPSAERYNGGSSDGLNLMRFSGLS